MEDQELLRYSKQIMLPQVDVEGQQKIMDSTVLIIGIGGLGSPTALYLAAAGVGHIVIADFDQVELSNFCLLYTSPSPRDRSLSRMPSSA